MTDLMVATDIGGDRLRLARARLPTAGAHAAETEQRIVDMLATYAGAAAIFESRPMGRAIRDVQAEIKHIAMNPASYAVTGRLRFGLDPERQGSEESYRLLVTVLYREEGLHRLLQTKLKEDEAAEIVRSETKQTDSPRLSCGRLSHSPFPTR